MSGHNLKEGDLVKVKRWDPVPYWHWGVYVGNGEVIHLSGGEFRAKGKDTAYVHRVTWKQFLEDSDQFECIPCPPDVDREEVVRRAKSAEGGLFRNRPYDLFSNNCEHFARWCHGGAESKQVQEVAKWAAIGSAVFAIGVGVFAAFSSADNEKEEKEEKHHYQHA